MAREALPANLSPSSDFHPGKSSINIPNSLATGSEEQSALLLGPGLGEMQPHQATLNRPTATKPEISRLPLLPDPDSQGKHDVGRRACPTRAGCSASFLLGAFPFLPNLGLTNEPQEQGYPPSASNTSMCPGPHTPLSLSSLIQP